MRKFFTLILMIGPMWLAFFLMNASQVQAAPHWYKDKKWWIGEAVIAGMIAADAHSTATRRPGLVEKNPFVGQNPSTRKVAGIALLDFGIQSSLHAGAWHFTHHVPTTEQGVYREDKLGWRIVGYTAIPAVVTIINGHAAARNYALK